MKPWRFFEEHERNEWLGADADQGLEFIAISRPRPVPDLEEVPCRMIGQRFRTKLEGNNYWIYLEVATFRITDRQQSHIYQIDIEDATGFVCRWYGDEWHITPETEAARKIFANLWRQFS